MDDYLILGHVNYYTNIVMGQNTGGTLLQWYDDNLPTMQTSWLCSTWCPPFLGPVVMEVFKCIMCLFQPYVFGISWQHMHVDSRFWMSCSHSSRSCRRRTHSHQELMSSYRSSVTSPPWPWNTLKNTSSQHLNNSCLQAPSHWPCQIHSLKTKVDKHFAFRD